MNYFDESKKLMKAPLHNIFGGKYFCNAWCKIKIPSNQPDKYNSNISIEKNITGKKRSIIGSIIFLNKTSKPKSPTIDYTSFTTHIFLKWTNEWIICLPNMIQKVRYIVQQWIWRLSDLLIFISMDVVMKAYLPKYKAI